jgi:hypothetical protein
MSVMKLQLKTILLMIVLDGFVLHTDSFDHRFIKVIRMPDVKKILQEINYCSIINYHSRTHAESIHALSVSIYHRHVDIIS